MPSGQKVGVSYDCQAGCQKTDGGFAANCFVCLVMDDRQTVFNVGSLLRRTSVGFIVTVQFI